MDKSVNFGKIAVKNYETSSINRNKLIIRKILKSHRKEFLEQKNEKYCQFTEMSQFNENTFKNPYSSSHEKNSSIVLVEPIDETAE